MFILFFGIVQFLQSPMVADLISERISKNILAQEGIDLNFEKVDLRVFPPTTYFRNVSFKKEDKGNGLKVTLKAKRVGFHFGLLDFFSSKFIVSKISIYDAETKINFKADKKTRPKFDLKDFEIGKFQDLYRKNIISKLPFTIRQLELDEVVAYVNDKKFLLDKLSLKLFKRRFKLSGRLEEFKHLILEKWKPSEQELVFDFDLTKKQIVVKELSFKNREDRISFRGKVNDDKSGSVVDGSVLFFGRVENLALNLSFLKGIKGLVDAKIKVSNSLQDPDAKARFRFLELHSKYEKVERVILEIKKIKDSLTVTNLTILGKSPNIKSPLALISVLPKIEFNF